MIISSGIMGDSCRDKKHEIEWPYLALRVASGCRKGERSKNEQTRGCELAEFGRMFGRADQSRGRPRATLPRATAAAGQSEGGTRGAISARLAQAARDWAVSRPRPKLVSQPSPCLEVCTRPWACGVTIYRKILDIAHAPYVA